jgi:NADPH2:quinone reductase
VDGRRVAALVATGGYAEYVAAPAEAVFPLPDAVSDAAALAVIIPGWRRASPTRSPAAR